MTTVKQKKTIIITGTHLTPALELIRQLKSDPEIDWQINYIGRKNNSSVDNTPSIESNIIPKMGINFYSINCGKLDRRWIPNTIRGLPQTFKSVFQSFKLIKKIKPDVIISFGGYVSVPIIIGGFFKKIPSITHEQTLTNSLTTKINSLFVNIVALSFNNQKQKNSLPKHKIVVTGNLLRQELFNPKKSKIGDQIAKIKTKIIFITAGNQGSHVINLIIEQLLPELKNYFIIHQTGKNDFDKFNKLSKKYPNYRVFDYIEANDIGHIFNKSELIISRSGANTSQEIVALNKKSILIPLKISQQNEQFLNATWVKEKIPEFTEIIEEKNLNNISLLGVIKKLISLKVKNNITKETNNPKLLRLIHEII
ncbi:MAG TPA: UDP-N-acetylglucosamine--N-acetylmuramyl-(pentapeptide) pyrophosphoryl-undecaprenol N-acetylglucosamine transferase [Candidatus Woesebacteria bacterium]|nr:UDP-N-acetylglucosamine--N-acetylmuramyl-(pentapeptide) pyrophosphoryl-undecaprenol N-acetylglucosamine transferase [Candidatus Woesebacteria bacterium]